MSDIEKEKLIIERMFENSKLFDITIDKIIYNNFNDDKVIKACVLIQTTVELAWLTKLQKCILCGDVHHDYEFLDYGICNSKKTVGYDNINIEYNNNCLKGGCFKCGQKYSVVKCKEFGNISHYEGDILFAEYLEGIGEKEPCHFCCLIKEDRLPPTYV
ncbi:hypothetical protein ACLMAB_19695 [Brevibacillus laterosporus]